VILGDINPGGIVVANGDIILWGRLRGIAHAGAGGILMYDHGYKMEPTQLRIANCMQQAPKPTISFYPEVAYVKLEGIRITKAADFLSPNFIKVMSRIIVTTSGKGRR